MRINNLRTLGILLLVALMAPAGLLFSQGFHRPTTATKTSTARLNPATSATKTFLGIQLLAQRVRREVRPLKYDTDITPITWQMQATQFQKVQGQVRKMENDVSRLSNRKESLSPWQYQLLGTTKQDVHEILFQTVAAMNTLNAHHNTAVLALTPYSNYVKIISQRATGVANSVRDAFQHHSVDVG